MTHRSQSIRSSRRLVLASLILVSCLAVAENRKGRPPFEPPPLAPACFEPVTKLARPGYPSWSSSVEIVRRSTGRHGGKRVSIRLKDREGWFSTYRKAPGAPQGDPRWMIDIFGEEGAKKLGFVQTSDRTAIVPDADEINGIIRELNRLLREQGDEEIATRFYMTRRNQPQVAPREYITTFCEGGALPVSSDRDLFFHDIAYHTSSILLPEKVVRLAINQTRYLQQFLEFMNARTMPALNLETRNLVRNKLRSNRNWEIDEGTGNLTLPIQDPKTGAEHIKKYVVNRLVHQGRSPKDFLLEIAKSEVRILLPPSESRSGRYDYVSIKRAVNEFVKLHAQEPEFTEGLMLDVDELCAEIGRKRDSILKALQKME